MAKNLLLLHKESTLSCPTWPLSETTSGTGAGTFLGAAITLLSLCLSTVMSEYLKQLPDSPVCVLLTHLPHLFLFPLPALVGFVCSPTLSPLP